MQNIEKMVEVILHQYLMIKREDGLMKQERRLIISPDVDLKDDALEALENGNIRSKISRWPK